MKSGARIMTRWDCGGNQKDLTQNGEIFWWNKNRDFEFLGIAG